ncbi:MAG: hypothetical protein ABIK52_07360 [Bacteroidota bacterium]
MKFFLSILLICLAIFPASYVKADAELPKKWTISGSIRDRSNGEDLTGATVYILELNT